MEPSKTALRWMWTWITVGMLIVLVVIGFLIGIANALESVDAGLAEASEAVVGANGDVKPLPDYIQDVNASLGRVDQQLEPIPRHASTIRDRLGSIRVTLGGVEGSLNDTERSLNDTGGELNDVERSLNGTEGELNATEGRLNGTERRLNGTDGSLNQTSRSLADTSGALRSAATGLVSIRRTAGRIGRRLELAQDYRSLGTNGIWRRARFLNGGSFFDASSFADRIAPPANLTSPINAGGLRFVEGDADGIRSQLLDVSRHLTSICEQIPVDLPSLVDLDAGAMVPLQPRSAFAEPGSEEC